MPAASSAQRWPSDSNLEYEKDLYQPVQVFLIVSCGLLRPAVVPGQERVGDQADDHRAERAGRRGQAHGQQRLREARRHQIGARHADEHDGHDIMQERQTGLAARTSCTAPCWPRRPSSLPCRTTMSATISPMTSPSFPKWRTASPVGWCNSSTNRPPLLPDRQERRFLLFRWREICK